MRFIIALLTAVACFRHGRQIVVQIGALEARGAIWRPPTSTFADRPSSLTTLDFAVTSGYVQAATARILTWEVCGYAAR
jgi:hypothetical protein